MPEIWGRKDEREGLASMTCLFCELSRLAAAGMSLRGDNISPED